MSHLIFPVIIAVIKKGNTYLLTKRAESSSPKFIGKWQQAGGGMEFGETPLQTLHREVKEEVGIEVTNVRLLPQIYTQVRDTWQGIFICFFCEMKDPNAQIKINHEASDWGWYTVDEVKKLDILPNVIEPIELAESLFS